MSTIPAAAPPVATVARTANTKLTAPEDSGPQFGGVLAREINRQESEKPTQVDAAVKDEPATDQQAAASPWLLMLQQFGQSLPVPPPQTLQSSGVDDIEPEANQSDALLQWVQQSVTTIPVSNGSMQDGQPSEQPLSTGQSGVLETAVTQNLPQMAATVSTGTGKELPQELDIASKQSTFADALGTSLNTASDTQTQQLLQPAQGASLQIEQNAAITHRAISQHAVHEPVGDARWGDTVAQRVSLMLGRQEQKMEMQLNPPHLGPMEVRLTLGQDQANVVFASQHAVVREALAAATPRLTALLADQGIQLVSVQVSSDSLQQQAQEQSQNQNALREQNQGARGILRQPMDAPIEMRPLTGLGLPVGRSGVSLYI